MPGPAALERLYDEHAQALFAYVLNLTRHEADTRDILQEVFVKIARDESRLNGVREERAYLIRLAHNSAIDSLRRRGTRERTRDACAEMLSPFVPTADPDAQLFDEQLAAALLELPVEQRTVVQLKLWSGLTFEEIATALEISPNTTASRYRYGVDKLRALLRPLYEELKRS